MAKKEKERKRRRERRAAEVGRMKKVNGRPKASH